MKERRSAGNQLTELVEMLFVLLAALMLHSVSWCHCQSLLFMMRKVLWVGGVAHHHDIAKATNSSGHICHIPMAYAKQLSINVRLFLFAEYQFCSFLFGFVDIVC